MNEKYVLSYLDLEEDKFKTLYFDGEPEAHEYLKTLKSTSKIMSDMIMSESKYEEFEMEQAISDEDWES